MYSETKSEIKSFLSSDGFAEFKERAYKFTIDSLGECSLSKEEYIAMRPSYDMKNCKFVKS